MENLKTLDNNDSIAAQPKHYEKLFHDKKIIINQLGYEPEQFKSAILCGGSEAEWTIFNKCVLRDLDSNEIYPLEISEAQKVNNWGLQNYQSVEFSKIIQEGSYSIEAIDKNGISIFSDTFIIQDRLFENYILPQIVSYYKSQRCSGDYQLADENMSFHGTKRTTKVDVGGGWYDASGDLSKYLSHLSYANFMNPQQTPLVVYALAQVQNNPQISQHLKTQYLEEAAWGGDFLSKMCDPTGMFYQTVFDVWSGDANNREICEFSTQDGHKHDTWEAGFRQGAGISIAALAKLSQLDKIPSEKREKYTTIAMRAFAHLEIYNTVYLNNGEENIIDIYCALFASTALFNSTKLEQYKLNATKYANRLMDCLTINDKGNICWFMDKQKTRVFNHAADEGIPIIALIDYYNIATHAEQSKVKITINIAVKLIINNALDGVNPFHYPRHIVGVYNDVLLKQFFYPHKNESGYWWQGENARLGSLITAFNKAIPFLSVNLAVQANMLSDKWQSWILGLNPYSTCMFQGVGQNDNSPQYGLAKIPNVAGGICNGITSKLNDEKAISFCETEDPLQSWRWSEQWLPHSAWFLMALCSKRQNH